MKKSTCIAANTKYNHAIWRAWLYPGLCLFLCDAFSYVVDAVVTVLAVVVAVIFQNVLTLFIICKEKVKILIYLNYHSFPLHMFCLILVICTFCAFLLLYQH